jgi:hypothetical protein
MAAPKANSDGVRRLPAQVLDHPTWMPRLTWKGGPRVPIDPAAVAESIDQARDVAFFCDNSVFHDGLDERILSALITTPKRMALTPLVMEELRPWLMRRPDHRLTQAIKKRDAEPLEVSPPERGHAGRNVYDYYMWLLLMRRSSIAVAERQFEDQHGRKPDPTERTTLEERIHRDLGQRGYMLARKGPGALPTDEQLVCLATTHAIRSGQRTVILTGDADVEEQFFKLLWLMDTHYRGMLLAKRYVQQFALMNPHALPRDIAQHPQCPFEDEGTVLIDRGNADLAHVLPTAPRCVAIACWTVGVSHFSAMTFMAEREMMELLDVKDRTGGLSTDLLGSRNLHPWLAPLPIQGSDRGCAAVARDHRFPITESHATVAGLDIAQAVTNLERHVKLDRVTGGPVTIPSPHGTPVVYHARKADSSG